MNCNQNCTQGNLLVICSFKSQLNEIKSKLFLG